MDTILIVDFGSQLTQKIAKILRELEICCEVVGYDNTLEQIQKLISENKTQHNITGIILSGSPESAYETKTHFIPEIVFQANVPILGICYGMQIMAQQLGGKVVRSCNPEYGNACVSVYQNNILLDKLCDCIIDGYPSFNVIMSHGDQVCDVPKGFKITAGTPDCPIAAMENETLKMYGVQFHPEAEHTKNGMIVLEQFSQICGTKKQWKLTDCITDIITSIKTTVKNETVIHGISGGVDSLVAGVLLHKALGEQQLQCIFVDTGLLRLNEGDNVMAVLTEYKINVTRVNAQERFLKSLSGKTDPEVKRKIIGKEFVDIFKEEALKINNATFLSQGTIYSDVIESGHSGKAAAIKSHHNVGGLPADLGLKLIEPIRTFFKDEVRKIGLLLGIPKKMIMRHPFPGPGLAIRIIGEITPEKVLLAQNSDAILQEELNKNEVSGKTLYELSDQAGIIISNDLVTCVAGDARARGHIAIIRIVNTSDFMTAEPTKISFDVLSNISKRLMGIRGIGRVCYDMTFKPSGCIEAE